MFWLAASAAIAADLVPVPGALLRRTDRLEVQATKLVEGITGDRTLLLGKEGATLLGPDGDPIVRVQASGVEFADVSSGDRFVLVHEGGITLHQAGRELGRLGAVGTILDVAISADGRLLALSTTVGLSVYDSVDGRTLWSQDGEVSDVVFDAKGRLYAVKKGVLKQYDPSTGGPKTTKLTEPPQPPGLLPDGCLPVTGGTFCPSGAGGTGIQRPDGAMWILREGVFERWRPLPEGKIAGVGPEVQGGSTAIAWVAGDVLVARRDGTLERRAPDGSTVASVAIPSCFNCVPLLVGGEADGSFYAVAADGAWQRWGTDGAPIGPPGRATHPVDVDRLADGRWVTLDDQGRARIGKKPGSGKPTKKAEGMFGVDAGGESVAVWGPGGVAVYSTEGGLRVRPDLGPDRRPAAVALSADGSTVAILDDKGTLHAYRIADGRAVFRVTANIEGTQLAWAPGRGYLLAGGDPLRVFGATDGKEFVRVELAPDGSVAQLAVADNGALAVVYQTEGAGQLLRRLDWATIAQ